VAALIGAAIALYVAGRLAATLVLDQFDLHLRAANEPLLHRAIMTATCVYALLLAIPFMPAVEVGLGMLVMSGGKLALLVYASTVAALQLPYLAGRLVPPDMAARALGHLGLMRARSFIERLASQSTEQRMATLVRESPGRWLAGLVRHRYLTLAVLLNLPGNVVIGGGGGIALVAGMSRLYSFPRYFVTVALAVAPVPGLLLLAG